MKRKKKEFSDQKNALGHTFKFYNRKIDECFLEQIALDDTMDIRELAKLTSYQFNTNID